MKKNLLASVALVLLIGISCQKKIDVEAEKMAIINVLEEESDAVVDLDYNRLSETWLQTATATFVSAGSNNFAYRNGFEDIGNWMKGFTENATERFAAKLEQTNYKIKVHDRSAWATYDETWYDAGGEMVAGLLVTKILENIDGAWKIAYTSVIDKSSYDEATEGNEQVSAAEDAE